MKLHRGCDVTPDGSGLLCRQSRAGGLIFALFIIAAFAVPIYFTWQGRAWFFFGVLCLFAVFLVPLMIGDVISRFRATNWTLWAPPGKLWINVRSYQDGSSLDTPSVVELADSEIAEVCRYERRYTVPHNQHTKRNQKLVSLDLQLRTPDDGTLEKLIADCRKAPQPWRRFLFMRSQSKPTLHSISLPDAGRVRIAWGGAQGHNLAPRVERALRALEARLQVGQPIVDDEAKRAAEMGKDAEIDDRILMLVQAGNKIDAIKILRQERGLSLVDAKQFVEELSERS